MFKKISDFIGNIFSSEKKESDIKPKRSLSFNAFNEIGWPLLKEVFTGEKYPGGLGIDSDFKSIDYWRLREVSWRLFTENRYASGLIKRLLTNVIHKGLALESTIEGKLLGLTDEQTNEYTEDIETKFEIFSDNPEIVSYKKDLNFGQIQQETYKIALISGDCLQILRQNPVTNLPSIEIIDGINIRTPENLKTKKKVKYGIELNEKNEHTAYYVKDLNKKEGYTRIPAKGARTGRPIAWLVYGDKNRMASIRGMPLLAIILQALKETDRYADSEQRAAFLNSIIPLFLKKGQDKPGSKSFSQGAVRRTNVEVETEEGPEEIRINKMIPGLVMETLQQGEEPVSFTTARPNINYRDFENAIIASIAWSKEIPPAILRLAYSSNYSASVAEINEFTLFLDKEREDFSSQSNKKYYREWLLSMVMADLIEAPGLLEAYRDETQFLISGAWFSNNWTGIVKPSLRLNNEIKAYKEAISEGLITRATSAKKIFGVRYSTVIKKQIKENEDLVKALQPLINAGLIEDKNKQTTENV